MRKKILVLAASGLAMLATGATAQVTGSSSMSGPLAGSAATTFDNRTVGNMPQMTNTGIAVSFTGTGAFAQGSATGLDASPYVVGTSGTSFGQPVAGYDTTVYVTSGIGSATLTFAGAQRYLGLLWGSIDPYNLLTFNFSDGTTQSFTGGQALAFGNGANGSEYINFTSTKSFNSVTASSTANAFEFDNVALTAVPEPATWALMLAGFGAVGFSMRRRKTTTQDAYAA